MTPVQCFSDFQTALSLPLSGISVWKEVRLVYTKRDVFELVLCSFKLREIQLWIGEYFLI